jgi:hypothetical protein
LYGFKGDVVMTKKQAAVLFGAALAGVVLSTNSADASTSNYDKFANKGYDNIVKLSDSDITSQLDSALRSAADKKTMIYITSGNHTLSDYNAVIPSNVAIIAEDDTVVTKTSGSMPMLRTKDAAKGATIYGGTYDGNHQTSNVFELQNAANFRMQNVSLTDGASAGLRLSDTTDLTLNEVNLTNNGQHGLFEDGSSSVRVNVVNADGNGANGYYVKGNGSDNSASLRGQKLSAKNNGQSGLAVTAGAHAQAYKGVYQDNANYGVLLSDQAVVNLKGSTVNSNDQAGVMVENSRLYANVYKNKITNNNYQGISAVKASKIYVKGAVVTGNGVNPQTDANGSNGHGIGVTEGAYGSIAKTTLDGNTDTGVSVFGNGSKADLSGNDISKNGRHGIGARQNVSLSIKSNTINNNGYNGVLMSDNTKVSAMSGNTINQNAQNGITIEASKASGFKANTLDGNGTNITMSKNASLVASSDNQILNSQAQGINVDDSTVKFSKANNVISGSKSNGMFLKNGSNLTVAKNGLTVSNNGESGITVKSSKAKLSAGSTFKDNAKYGIAVYGGSLSESGLNMSGNNNGNVYKGN